MGCSLMEGLVDKNESLCIGQSPKAGLSGDNLLRGSATVTSHSKLGHYCISYMNLSPKGQVKQLSYFENVTGLVQQVGKSTFNCKPCSKFHF